MYLLCRVFSLTAYLNFASINLVLMRVFFPSSLSSLKALYEWLLIFANPLKKSYYSLVICNYRIVISIVGIFFTNSNL